MKIFVATRLTQGARANDYNYCVPGELVWIQEPCDRDRRNPDGGWPQGWAAEVVDENLAIALRFPAGTIIERRQDEFQAPTA